MTDDLDRLERVARLRAEGAITPAEFDRLKAGLLDELTADPTRGAPRGRRPFPTVAIAAVVALVTIAAAAILLGRKPTADLRTDVRPATTASPHPSPTASPQAVVAPPTAADFVITRRLLRDKPSYDDLNGAPTQVSICLGEKAVVANASGRTVGLVDTPDESDASATLGMVRPGAVFSFEPTELGIFFLSDADEEGLLFRYVVKRCKRRR